jgi:peptidoglycan/xylan/chitin deacetylase (PgdA/CDA1 family)
MSDVLVLCYHAVSDRWEADLSVTRGSLERQLELLLGQGYRGVTFREAVSAAPWPKTLAVTFDDAFRSVFELAFPLLSSLGIPATVFVPTQHVGTDRPMSWPGIHQWVGGPTERELVGMSWDELAALADAGWEIGSHTRKHPHLTRLDDAALARELRGSREECETRLERPCLSLAYPYGDVDSRVETAARAAGYLAAGELSRRLVPGAPLRWPRIGVYHDDGGLRFRLKSSRAVRSLRVFGATARRRLGRPRVGARAPRG